MSTASTSPRYGSAAELAAYAGVSTKTIRRLVEARKVRGLKLGRRLVIPFADLDAHVLRIAETGGPAEPTPSTSLPRSAFDPSGLAVELPPDEERRCQVRALQALDDLDGFIDEDEQAEAFRAVMAGLEDEQQDGWRFGG